MEEQSVYKNLLKLGVEQNPKIQASLQKMQTANSKMDTYIQLRKMAEGIKGNTLKMSDVPAKYRTFVSDILLKEGYDPSEEDPEVKKIVKKAGDVIDRLEELYFGTEKAGDELKTGRGITGLIAKGSAALGFNERMARYNKLKQASRASLARALGEKGNLSETEQQVIIESLPGAFSTQEEAIGGFNDLRRILGLPTKEYAVEKGTSVPGKIAGTVFGPKSKEYVESRQGEPVSKTIEQNLLGLVSPAAPLITSPEGRGAAKEVATDVVVAILFGKLIGKTKDLLGIGGKKAGVVRTKIAKILDRAGVRVDGDRLVKASERALEKATPDEARYLKRMVKEAAKKYGGKQLKVKQAVDLMSKTGAKSFTKSKSPKVTASAALNRELYGEIRAIFSKVAPEILEETLKMSKGIATTNILKKAGYITGGGIVGSIGTGIGINLFGKRY